MDTKETEKELTPVQKIEKELSERRAKSAAKAATKNDADKLRRLEREIAFEDAKLAALDKYMPDELFEPDVAGVGVCLLHWPDEVTYNHFMKGSGAIRGDMSGMTIEKVEDLLARCTIFPDPPTFLKELRAKNPHARTVIQNKLFEKMRGQLDEEGKK
jgi:hypothetical protein